MSEDEIMKIACHVATRRATSRNMSRHVTTVRAMKLQMTRVTKFDADVVTTCHDTSAKMKR